MIVCSSMRTEGVGALAARRRAGDAHARRGHRLEARLGNSLAAHLALAVGAGVEFGECVLDVLQGLAQLPGEGLDLAPLGGDLARVGEILVEVEVGIVSVAEARQLFTDLVALLLELVAQQLLGCLGHGSSLLPASWAESSVHGRSGRRRL